jgi:phosphoglycolate phosphatase
MKPNELSPSRLSGSRSADPVTAVLWDVDVTLITSHGVTARAFIDAVEEVTGRRPASGDLDLGGRIDPEIAAVLLASVGASCDLVPAVLERLALLVDDRLDELEQQVRPLQGVVELLKLVASFGVRQTVVTGNIESVGLRKLQAARLIPPIVPDYAGFGDHGHDRVEVARGALDRLTGAGWVWSPEQCRIVGDTPRDADCARALGLRCALVATGRHSAASMAGLGADLVLESLAAAEELLELWGLGALPRR